MIDVGIEFRRLELLCQLCVGDIEWMKAKIRRGLDDGTLRSAIEKEVRIDTLASTKLTTGGGGERTRQQAM